MATMNETMIQLTDALSKAYGDVTVLDKVQPGGQAEIPGAAGRVGCGKSTLLLMAGFSSPTRARWPSMAKTVTDVTAAAAWCFSSTRCFRGTAVQRALEFGFECAACPSRNVPDCPQVLEMVGW